ncbi:hypothetical protein R3X26_10805 [Vibrio sp. TH_r3]|uniref:hypothetical protein n=1 Tax=Vibrio sp. TH_r3 TaxID=3082084 RepID=UPI00295598ED|nr:hypothetical protein [Vibrio sp. TH_r3]MDV7104889.1 hypothetical protein [Vibrio sp. TH_r3]
MYLHLLLKFGKKSYLPDFRRVGRMRLGRFASFRQFDNCQIGDKNEGTHKIETAKSVNVLRKNPETNEFEQILDSAEANVRIRHYNDLNESSRIFCFYYAIVDLTKEVRLSEVIDKDMLQEFQYDYVVGIYNLKKFYKKLDDCLDKTDFPYRRGMVEYVDLSQGKEQVSPFEKDLRFSHQRELRLCVQNVADDAPLYIEIGDISKFSFECSVDEIEFYSFKTIEASVLEKTYNKSIK